MVRLHGSLGTVTVTEGGCRRRPSLKTGTARRRRRAKLKPALRPPWLRRQLRVTVGSRSTRPGGLCRRPSESQPAGRVSRYTARPSRGLWIRNLGSGPRYQILSHLARCASQKTHGHAKLERVQFSHVRVFSDRDSRRRNVQKNVTRIIYLGPLPNVTRRLKGQTKGWDFKFVFKFLSTVNYKQER